MKKILTILLFFPILVYSQEYPTFDIMDFGKNVRTAYLYRHYETETQSTIIEKYIFNNKGQHVITYNGFNSSSQLKKIYEYQGTKLITYKKLYHDSSDDSLSSNENAPVIFEKINWNNSVTWEDIKIKYDSLGNVSNYEIYNHLSNDRTILDETISFIYNSDGKLEKKTWKEQENPDVLKFQFFESSSLEISDSIKNISGNYREKIFQYLGDTTKILYYLNAKLTGIEYQVYNHIDRIKSFVITNSSGDTLSISKEWYNENKQLIAKKRIYHSGYNGFGYSLDLEMGDEFYYKFDTMGNLNQIDCYDDGKFYYRDEYKIKNGW